MKADRFRAYSQTEVQNRRDSAPSIVEEIAAEGKTDGTASASFNAGDKKITRVVFYSGPVAREVVVGSVDVNASGKVNAELADEE